MEIWKNPKRSYQLEYDNRYDNSDGRESGLVEANVVIHFSTNLSYKEKEEYGVLAIVLRHVKSSRICTSTNWEEFGTRRCRKIPRWITKLAEL